MKRFVTYLYEYKKGNKSKNVGFIRVNIKDKETLIQVMVQNCQRNNEIGKVVALIHRDRLLGIELGEIKIVNGQSDSCISFATDNITDRGCSVNEIVGIGILLENKECFVSSWKDEFVEEIIGGAFLIGDMLAEESNVKIPEEITEATKEISEVPASQLNAAEEKRELEEQIWNKEKYEERKVEPERNVSYRKIDLSQIRELPSPNWHYTTNSFLVHGYWNYGYLVLKKNMEENKEKLSLGVPGIFEKPEMVMAVLFGFTGFAALPSEMVEEEMNAERTFPHKEKNQEPREGLFGCWFVDLKN